MEEEQKNNEESSNTGEDAGPSLAATNSTGPNLPAKSSGPTLVTPEDDVARSIRHTQPRASCSTSQESVFVASRKFYRSASGVLSLQEVLKEKQV